MDAPPKSSPVQKAILPVLSSRSVDHPRERVVCVRGHLNRHAWVTFIEFRGVDIDLNDTPDRGKALPRESGLLKAESGSDGDDYVCLLQQYVCRSLAPCVGTAPKVAVVGRDAISAVPRMEKNTVVTPKKPTQNGPIQKSNRSPPINVPPRTRYFLSKLSMAIAVFSAREARKSGPLLMMLVTDVYRRHKMRRVLYLDLIGMFRAVDGIMAVGDNDNGRGLRLPHRHNP